MTPPFPPPSGEGTESPPPTGRGIRGRSVTPVVYAEKCEGRNEAAPVRGPGSFYKFEYSLFHPIAFVQHIFIGKTDDFDAVLVYYTIPELIVIFLLFMYASVDFNYQINIVAIKVSNKTMNYLLPSEMKVCHLIMSNYIPKTSFA